MCAPRQLNRPWFRALFFLEKGFG